MRFSILPFLFCAVLLSGCANSVSCDKIENPPFGDRLTLSKELPNDGPTSQKWIVKYSYILEECGYE